MRVLVTGGSSSGKSALAERYTARLGGRLLYVATMRPPDRESAARVQKHRRQREGMGFDTLECYNDLSGVDLGGRFDSAVLECAGNLTANVMFGEGSPGAGTVERVLGGVENLSAQLRHLVVVTNEVFSAAEQYGGGTADYLVALGEINRVLAQRFDLVVRAVCGLPLLLKGGEAYARTFD